MWQKIKDFMGRNDAMARCLRTIIQGVLAVLLENLGMILTGFHLDASTQAVVTALLMAVISPIMAQLKEE